jgi:catechol 2,3-dioxygenase-like lactoylglutathione lyase family enzyme
MAIRKPHHIGAFTPNLAKTEAFYTQILGLPVVGRIQDGGTNIAFIDLGGTCLELIESKDRTQPAPPNHSGLAHIALEVDDVDAVYQDLVSKGVQFHVHPMDAGHGIRLAFFRDPDGLEIELFKQD